jgi:heme/copper-type cytochrome/quinol oxidase subunit 2
MAESSAIHSYNATLSYSTTSGGSYTAVGEVIDYTHNAKAGSSNVTHLTSQNAHMEKKPKMVDPGSITFTCNFVKTVYEVLYDTIFKTRTQYYWKITLPDNSTLTPFHGHISDISLVVPDDDRITCDVTIDITSSGDAFTAG